MNIVTREAKEADFEAVRSILREGDLHHSRALPHIFRELSPGEELRSDDYLKGIIEDENSAIIVAERAGKIIGAIHVTIRQTPDYPIIVPRRFAVIETLIVTESQRRSGIGKALMNHTHYWAAERGISQVELNVWDFNEGAIRLYEDLGYQTASRRMCKKLDR